MTIHLDPDIEPDPIREYLHRAAPDASGTTGSKDPVEKWTEWISAQTGLGGRDSSEATSFDPFPGSTPNDPDSTVYLWFEDAEAHPAWKHDAGLEGTEFIGG